MKEKLERRLEDLGKELDAHVTNAKRTEGAIILTRQLLQELEEESKEKEEIEEEEVKEEEKEK